MVINIQIRENGGGGESSVFPSACLPACTCTRVFGTGVTGCSCQGVGVGVLFFCFVCFLVSVVSFIPTGVFCLLLFLFFILFSFSSAVSAFCKYGQLEFCCCCFVRYVNRHYIYLFSPCLFVCLSVCLSVCLFVKFVTVVLALNHVS